MKKRTFITEFNIHTQVTVDVPDNFSIMDIDDETRERIAKAAADNIRSNPDGYFCEDNLMEIWDDAPDF